MDRQQNIEGQLSAEEFAAYFDEHGTNIKLVDGWAVTGKSITVNYWTRHADGSWTNYDCHTKPERSIFG